MGGALAMAVARSEGDYELMLANRNPEKADKLLRKISAETEVQVLPNTQPDKALAEIQGKTETLTQNIHASVDAHNQIGAEQTKDNAARHCGKAIKTCTNMEAAEEADYLFLGVKPQMMEAMLNGIRPVLTERIAAGKGCVLISMAAGIAISDISRMTGGCPVIRIMPNTPVEIGEGVVLYTLGEGVTDSDASELKLMLSKAGLLTELPEKLIDAGSAVSGCGPAFTYMFIEALADGGVLCGLTRADAYRFAAQMIAGSAKLMLKSGKHPGELKDAVCSPGGTTIEGVRELEAGGLRGTVIEAVIAACQKNAALKK